MLLDRKSTYFDRTLKRAEPIFPKGTDWQAFKSIGPNVAVFKDSVLDPSIGITGDLTMATLQKAALQNVQSLMRIATFELSTRIGLPDGMAGVKGQLGDLFALGLDIASMAHLPRNELIDRLAKELAGKIIQALAQSGNPYAVIVAIIAGTVLWIMDVVADANASRLGKDIPLPPLQSADPATDEWQCNRVFELMRMASSGEIQHNGDFRPASNADYTPFYLPRFKGEWVNAWRADGMAVARGPLTEGLGPLGAVSFPFQPNGNAFGFAPGTGQICSVLQSNWGGYYAPAGTVGRYDLLCRYVDKGCGKREESFEGDKDCRQCVTAESVWPQEGIGWAIAGLPLNATTPGDNVGTFYTNTTMLLGMLLDMANKPSPLMFTINVQEYNDQWKEYYQSFWDWVRWAWKQHNGYGWRGQLSRIASFMTAYEYDGRMVNGGRNISQPMDTIADPREDSFGVWFGHSTYVKLIQPFAVNQQKRQMAYAMSGEVAYIPPGAGAVFTPGGRYRDNQIGQLVKEQRAELLKSTARHSLNLNNVSDTAYYAELVASGVKPSPLNPALSMPMDIGTAKPSRARPPKPPRAPVVAIAAVVLIAPVLGAVKLAAPLVGRAATSDADAGSGRIVFAVVGVFGVMLVAGAIALAMSRRRR